MRASDASCREGIIIIIIVVVVVGRMGRSGCIGDFNCKKGRADGFELRSCFLRVSRKCIWKNLKFTK